MDYSDSDDQQNCEVGLEEMKEKYLNAVQKIRGLFFVFVQYI